MADWKRSTSLTQPMHKLKVTEPLTYNGGGFVMLNISSKKIHIIILLSFVLLLRLFGCRKITNENINTEWKLLLYSNLSWSVVGPLHDLVI